MQFAQLFSNGNSICNNYSSTVIPEVIGEGDVTSLIFPDGTRQYLFQPRNFLLNPALFKSNYVWIIRSIAEPQYIQPIYFTPSIMQTPYQQVEPMEQCFEPPRFPLKFHNSAMTSTTDLHYFFPKLRQCEWIPKVDASVQSTTILEPSINDCQCNKKFDNTNIEKKSSKTMFVNIKDSIDVCKKKIKMNCHKNISTTDADSRFTSFLKRRKHADYVHCKCKNSKLICNCGVRSVSDMKKSSSVESRHKDSKKRNVSFQVDNSKISQTSGCACVVKYNL